MSEQRSDKHKTKLSTLIIRLILILFAIFALIYFYARYIETKNLIVNEYKITSNKVDDKFDGLKVVHFSDIHYGLTIEEAELKKVVDKINFIKPDIIVFTGDLLDKNEIMNKQKINILSSALKKLNAKYGKYSIKGNHDYNNDNYEQIMNNSEFTILEDSNDIIYGKDKNIFIAGASSSIKSHIDFNKTLSGLTDNMYSIVLLHEPDSVTELLKTKKVDLVLAGHSHGGQIRLPFTKTLFKVNGSKNYNEDYYLIDNTQLFISFGIGTSTYPFRTFNPSSINFYRINKK